MHVREWCMSCAGSRVCWVAVGMELDKTHKVGVEHESSLQCNLAVRCRESPCAIERCGVLKIDQSAQNGQRRNVAENFRLCAASKLESLRLLV